MAPSLSYLPGPSVFKFQVCIVSIQHVQERVSVLSIFVQLFGGLDLFVGMVLAGEGFVHDEVDDFLFVGVIYEVERWFIKIVGGSEILSEVGHGEGGLTQVIESDAYL
jgi:hypothetical protein